MDECYIALSTEEVYNATQTPPEYKRTVFLFDTSATNLIKGLKCRGSKNVKVFRTILPTVFYRNKKEGLKMPTRQNSNSTMSRIKLGELRDHILDQKLCATYRSPQISDYFYEIVLANVKVPLQRYYIIGNEKFVADWVTEHVGGFTGAWDISIASTSLQHVNNNDVDEGLLNSVDESLIKTSIQQDLFFSPDTTQMVVYQLRTLIDPNTPQPKELKDLHTIKQLAEFCDNAMVAPVEELEELVRDLDLSEMLPPNPTQKDLCAALAPLAIEAYTFSHCDNDDETTLEGDVIQELPDSLKYIYQTADKSYCYSLADLYRDIKQTPSRELYSKYDPYRRFKYTEERVEDIKKRYMFAIKWIKTNINTEPVDQEQEDRLAINGFIQMAPYSEMSHEQIINLPPDGLRELFKTFDQYAGILSAATRLKLTRMTDVDKMQVFAAAAREVLGRVKQLARQDEHHYNYLLQNAVTYIAMSYGGLSVDELAEEVDA